MKTSLGLTRKMHRALAILTAIKVDEALVQKGDSRIVIEAYSNCREQGFCIWIMPTIEQMDKQIRHHSGWKISFAENRNSDEIFVCCNDSRLFSAQGNVPNEEAYKSRRYFERDEEAVIYIGGLIAEFFRTDV